MIDLVAMIYNAQLTKNDSKTKPVLFDIGDDADKGAMTVTDKLNRLMMLLETFASRLIKQAEGYCASTKFLLEEINSNLVQAHVIAGAPDTNYNMYEKKLIN